MHEVVEIDVPARPEYLALVRVIVASAVGTQPMFDDERIDDLRLVVSEACTNAIEASSVKRNGRAALDPLRMSVRCEIEPEEVLVEVRDEGPGFDPAALVVHPPAHDPARLDHERGLGIPLMRMLSDKADFLVGEAGTTVRLVLRAEPGGIGA